MALLARLAALLLLASPLIACDDPCAELDKKVCQPKTSRLKRLYSGHCKLMQEKERRENLPSRTCESVLEHLSKR